MTRPQWLKRPMWTFPGRVFRRTSSEHTLSRRELLLVAAVLLVPIPLLAVSGLRLPLLGAVERGVASLLPGGWEEATVGDILPASDSLLLVDDGSSGRAGPSGDGQSGGGGEGAVPGGASDQPSSPGGNATDGAPSGDPQDEPAGSSGSSGGSGSSSPTSNPPNSGGGGGGSGSGGEEPDATASVSVGLPGTGGVVVSGGVTGSDPTPEVGGSVSVDTPLEGGDVAVTGGAEVPDAGDAAGGLTNGATLPSGSANVNLGGLPLNLPLPISLP